ncbi:eukaryotic DNA topoisomerase I [Ganoderma leucocontextum]|nr:eukaryotic DNA topoisomerase I [Ganoderma leucocontextum]
MPASPFPELRVFEQARGLKDYIVDIRASYGKSLKSPSSKERQYATAMYLIDKLSLGESLTVESGGCCALRCGDVGVIPPNQLLVDYCEPVWTYFERVVPEAVYQNIRAFTDGKDMRDLLFDQLSAGELASHLASYVPGLTSKVLRIYNASTTLQYLLDEDTPEDGDAKEFLVAFHNAKRITSILCNLPIGKLEAVVDPRISISWFKRHGISLSNLSPTYFRTYPWAGDTEAGWRF